MATLKQLQNRTLGIIGFGASLGLSIAAHAAAPTVTTGGLGEQVTTMSGEAMSTGGTLFGMGCYLAAALCFILGAWALWASRQPQNRESGYMARGIAGFILCGLFVAGGTWIVKSAATAGGATGTNINGTNNGMVTFQ